MCAVSNFDYVDVLFLGPEAVIKVMQIAAVMRARAPRLRIDLDCSGYLPRGHPVHHFTDHVMSIFPVPDEEAAQRTGLRLGPAPKV